jgi:hypothetical protein
MNALAPPAAAVDSTRTDDASIARLLGAVCERLDSAAEGDGRRAREAAALAIIGQVASFVLEWEEGHP